MNFFIMFYELLNKKRTDNVKKKKEKRKRERKRPWLPLYEQQVLIMFGRWCFYSSFHKN